jgi:integrase
VKTKRLKIEAGIYRVVSHGKPMYVAIKKVKGKKLEQRFKKYQDASLFMKSFNQKKPLNHVENPSSSTLKDVWENMKLFHFPTLQEGTKEVWERRYTLLKPLEEYEMLKLNPTIITQWLIQNVAYYRSDEYEMKSRGYARRCNFNNELCLLSTICNWYKGSDIYAGESALFNNPVRTKRHKNEGIVRAVPIRHRDCKPEELMRFATLMPTPYKELALLQYHFGSRISEVVGLKWDRVNFNNGLIEIRETARFKNKQFVGVNPFPKNKSPYTIPMNESMKEILHTLHRLRRTESPFVFHTDGRPINYSTLLSRFRRAQIKAGIEARATHVLRMGRAKSARRLGGLDAVIAVTNHKDHKMADHYSKLDQEYKTDIFDRLDLDFRAQTLKKEVVIENSNLFKIDFNSRRLN